MGGVEANGRLCLEATLPTPPTLHTSLCSSDSPHPYPEGQAAIGKSPGGVMNGVALKRGTQGGGVQRAGDVVPGEFGQQVRRVRFPGGLCGCARRVGAVKLKQLPWGAGGGAVGLTGLAGSRAP